MALKDGEVLLLENVRFYKAEEIKDKKAKEDAALRKEKEISQSRSPNSAMSMSMMHSAPLTATTPRC